MLAHEAELPEKPPKLKPCGKCGESYLVLYRVREQYMCEYCGQLEIAAWNDMAAQPLGLPAGVKIG